MSVRFLIVAMLAAILAAGCGPAPKPDPAAVISAQALAERIAAGTVPLVLDVRTPEEHAAGHIPGALNIPHDELDGRLAELPVGKADEIVVHCKSGRRAGKAEEVLRAAGYTGVRDLTGHWQGWESAGLPRE